MVGAVNHRYDQFRQCHFERRRSLSEHEIDRDGPEDNAENEESHRIEFLYDFFHRVFSVRISRRVPAAGSRVTKRLHRRIVLE